MFLYDQAVLTMKHAAAAQTQFFFFNSDCLSGRPSCSPWLTPKGQTRGGQQRGKVCGAPPS
jgi:hypothetical protein